ncbi:MAG: choice-of-anchor Q domain-containing protein [Candidatus Cloacimonetes bacterium]|nr:choice-of-anchor Q domain-containing protein [Candidatus Cloacimonadota bacterium]
MKKTYILFIILNITLTLFSTSYTVKLDGTGDFTSIQEAINASTNGTTIVVYPGRYYENINFSGKNIFLTSLYSISNDRNDIYNTIIDANQQDSGVVFKNGETRQAILNGFTIENGIGNASMALTRVGGGISVISSSPSILNCIIHNNIILAGPGGGIGIVGGPNNYISYPYLSGNIIKNNNSYNYGGGIFLNSFGYADFDPVNKNSIFNNMAASSGYDIFSFNDWAYMNVVLDTFTVATDDYDFINMYFDYDFSCDNYIIDSFINQDLYVSPDGDDINNDGLSFGSPFQTISHAMYSIASDSLNPKTIYLAPGTYTSSGSNQVFPVHTKSYVSVIGAGRDLTILDSEQKGGFFTNVKESRDITIAGIGFQNNVYNMIYRISRPIRFASYKNVEISDCAFRAGYGALVDLRTTEGSWNFNSDSHAVFKNLLFENNINKMIFFHTQRADFENIIIFDNHIYYDDPFYYGPCPINLLGYHTYRSQYNFSNLLVYNNESYLELDWPVLLIGNVFSLVKNQDVFINNATITGNTLNPGVEGGPIYVSDFGVNIKIYNSIFYNNTPGGLWFEGYQPVGEPNHLYINNTLLEGGESAVQAYYNDIGVNHILHWGEGNLDVDPQFLTAGEYPFQLSDTSPCIDAGTLDIPDYVFPETDIMGNPRVSGATVDIGAYEYQGLNANFTAEPLSGEVPLEVQFTDQSSGVVFAWGWDFDLDGYIDSYEQNPTYTYTEPGVYSVRLVINNGEKSVIKEGFIDVLPTSDGEEVYKPLITNIAEPYPNPFRGKTMFNATINEPGVIGVNIYNIKGQKVRSLVNETKDVGIYRFVWDGEDNNRKRVASGIYTIEMKHNNKKIGVVKVSYIK